MTMDFTDVDTVDKRRQEKTYSLDIAEVVSVPSDGGHVVSVRRLGDEGGVIGAPALVPSKGDVGLPEPGDIVVIGFAIGGQRIVIGTLYEDDSPSYKRGERIIGHSRTDASIRITQDGAIFLTSADGKEVSVNGIDIAGHIADTTNPHETTLEQARSQDNSILGNVISDISGNDVWRVRDGSGGSNASPYTFRFDMPRDIRWWSDSFGTVVRFYHSGLTRMFGDAQVDGSLSVGGDVTTNTASLNTTRSDLDTVQTTLDGHIADTDNPHNTTLEEARTQNNTILGRILFDGDSFTTHVRMQRNSEPVDISQGNNDNIYITWENAASYGSNTRYQLSPTGDISHEQGVTINGEEVSGSDVYVGSFEVTSTGNITISTPFAPTMIEFHGEAVGGQNVDRGNGSGSSINNYQGSFSGTARSDGHRQVVHSGGSGNSINSTSHYSSTTNCIAIRYAGQDGELLGRLLGDVSSFNSNGFTVNISEFAQNEVITFTAYR